MLGRTRLGWLLVVFAFLASAQTPARTAPIACGLMAVIFWLYLKRPAGGRGTTTSTRLARIAVVGVVVLALFVYFRREGHTLNKDTLASNYPVQTRFLPSSLVVPYLYLEGGISAFAYARQIGYNPTTGTDQRGAPFHGRTVFILPRAEKLVDPSVKVPQTVPPFVTMPLPSNIYTWAGDLYFDWGVLGVILGSFLVGAIMMWLTQRARSGRVADYWVLSAATVILLFQSIAFEWLWLSTLFWMVSGYFVIRYVVDDTPVHPSARGVAERLDPGLSAGSDRS
jgi:oligosaccharide repeat unit polymerase